MRSGSIATLTCEARNGRCISYLANEPGRMRSRLLTSPTRVWGAIQYSPEKYPENCPEKCPELCNCSSSYFLNFLAVIFEGYFGTIFGTIFGILFGTVLNCTPRFLDMQPIKG